MRIFLIQPALELDRKYGQKLLQMMFRPAPITLPTIAAITPPEHTVEIVDDAFMEIPYEAKVDVVGITGSTPFANRMREISETFRARGVKVVVGGVYATLCPQQAKAFADAVVVGDAEDTWPQALQDIARGELKEFYYSQWPALTGRPFPRRELLKSWRYILPTSFQFIRGCVHACEFCSINIQYGNRVRKTPVEAAIADLCASRRHWLRPVMIWDDNLFNDPHYLRELFAGMKECGIKWVGQSTLLIAKEPELLKLAAESGCIALFIGLESFSPDCLRETYKGFNKVEQYKESIKRIHDVGISVQAGLIFGFDHDDPAVFERTVEAACEIKLDVAAISLFTPYPGTEIFARLEREGRILTYDLSKYDSDHVVFRPLLMSPEDLQEGWHWVQHQFYSVPNTLRRTLGGGGSLRIKLATSLQYNWFTKLRFPKGYNPAAKQLGAATRSAHLLPESTHEPDRPADEAALMADPRGRHPRATPTGYPPRPTEEAHLSSSAGD